MKSTGLGVNTCIDRGNKHGLDLKKGTNVRASVRKLTIATGDHPLAHPRANLPVDEALVADIMSSPVGIREKVEVWEDAGKLYVIDGSRRTRAGLVIFERTGKELEVDLRYFVGSFSDAILRRLECNSDPTKLPDSAQVLSDTIIAALKYGATLDDVLKRMPREVGAKEAEALTRFGNLDPLVAGCFNDPNPSTRAPIGLLPAVLDVKRSEQMKTLKTLMSGGITTARGATRKLNADKREKSGDARERVHPRTLTRVVEVTSDKYTSDDGEDIAKSCADTILSACDSSSKPVREIRAGVAELREVSVADGFALGVRFALGDRSALDTLPTALRTSVLAQLEAKVAKRSKK